MRWIDYNMDKNNKRIDCFKCKHYYVTWDKNFPRGCRAIGFKGKMIPSIAVLRTTGIPCQFFSKKEKK